MRAVPVASGPEPWPRLACPATTWRRWPPAASACPSWPAPSSSSAAKSRKKASRGLQGVAKRGSYRVKRAPVHRVSATVLGRGGGVSSRQAREHLTELLGWEARRRGYAAYRDYEGPPTV
eukprot:1196392-Prorocentrum_minimum.AAC.4